MNLCLMQTPHHATAKVKSQELLISERKLTTFVNFLSIVCQLNAWALEYIQSGINTLLQYLADPIVG